MSDSERIAVLERRVAALKELLTNLVNRYNWHDHKYDYSQNNNYDFDATTQPTNDRLETTDLEEAFK